MTGAAAGAAERWREYVAGDADVLSRFDDGGPALLRYRHAYYLACWPDAALLSATLRQVLACLDLTDLPPGVRLRRRGGLRFAINYGPEPWTAPEPDAQRYRIGGPVVAPQSVACWRE